MHQPPFFFNTQENSKHAIIFIVIQLQMTGKQNIEDTDMPGTPSSVSSADTALVLSKDIVPESESGQSVVKRESGMIAPPSTPIDLQQGQVVVPSTQITKVVSTVSVAS